MEDEIRSEGPLSKSAKPANLDKDQDELQSADARLTNLRKLHNRVVGKEATESPEQAPEVYDSVEDINLRELKRGDKFVVTTGSLPELKKSVYTVNVTGIRKDGLRVMVKDEITRKGVPAVDEFTARLVGEHVKTEAADPTIGMSFESVKYQKNEYGFLGAKAHRIAQIQSIALRRRQ